MCRKARRKMKVKNILYNQAPATEEELKELFDIINLVLKHTKKGVRFRFIIEELEELKDTSHSS